MKRAAILACILVLTLAFVGAAYAGGDKVKSQQKLQYGGFEVTITHLEGGGGTFTIVGTSCWGSVDVNGTFEIIADPEAETVTVVVTFGEGSIVETADDTVIDLSGETFTYSANASAKKVICAVVDYIKTLLEG